MLEKYQFLTLLATIIAGGWAFFRYFASRLDKLDAKMGKVEDKLSAQGERLARMEGILSWLEKYFLGADEN